MNEDQEKKLVLVQHQIELVKCTFRINKIDVQCLKLLWSQIQFNEVRVNYNKGYF